MWDREQLVSERCGNIETSKRVYGNKKQVVMHEVSQPVCVFFFTCIALRMKLPKRYLDS